MKKFVIALLALVMIFSMSMLVACGDPCKNGHSWNDGIETKAATCMEEGSMLFTCTECDETKTEPIEKIAHNLGSYKYEQWPTCSATGTKKASCKNTGCTYVDTQVAAIDPSFHDYNHAIDRILVWDGSGNNIILINVCHDCGFENWNGAPQSLGNYRTLDQLFHPGDRVNEIKEFSKLIYDYTRNNAAVSIMDENKVMEIGKASGEARTCYIDSSVTTTGATKSDIKGKITVVNGKLIVIGDVELSGSIVVKAGSTLEISEGATIANTGSITVEAGATLINNGTVSGTAIVNQNN